MKLLKKCCKLISSFPQKEALKCQIQTASLWPTYPHHSQQPAPSYVAYILLTLKSRTPGHPCTWAICGQISTEQGKDFWQATPASGGCGRHSFNKCPICSGQCHTRTSGNLGCSPQHSLSLTPAAVPKVATQDLRCSGPVRFTGSFIYHQQPYTTLWHSSHCLLFFVSLYS